MLDGYAVGPSSVDSCKNYGEVIVNTQTVGGIVAITKSDGTGINRISNSRNYGFVHGMHMIGNARRNIGNIK